MANNIQDIGKLLTTALERVNSLGDLNQTNGRVNANQNSSMSSGILRTAVQIKQPTSQQTTNMATSMARLFPTLNSSRKRAPQGTTRSARPKKSKSAKAVYRDLVLIPSPYTSEVPTHKTRLELESRGLVVHSFPFERHWDDKEIKSTIEKQFSQLGWIPFEFVKASYGKLIKPHLAEGVSMNGDLLLRTSGQGSVYVRSLEPISADDDDTDDLPEAFSKLPDETENNYHWNSFDPIDVDEESSKQGVQVETVQHSETAPFGSSTSFRPDVNVPVTSNPTSAGSRPDVNVPVTSNPTSAGSRPDVNVPVTSNPTSAGSSFGDSYINILNADTPTREIAVKRSNVLKDIINEFSSDDILHYNINVAFIDDRGEIEDGRGTGILREVLSIFWREVFSSLTTGATEKVPSIRHDYQKIEWESVAKVLVYGFVKEKYFPISISRGFIASCMFGEDEVPTECLLDSFYLYVSKDEADTLQKCVKGESGESNFDPSIDADLLDILGSYKCYRRPTKENIKKIIEELAHQELIQKPKYISNAWGPILSPLKQFQEFQNLEKFICMYSSKKPTSKKVVKLLEASPTSDMERESLEHLKRFIKSLDDNLLSIFLQFVTGSNVIAVDTIQVSFNTTTGASRGPTAHTCGPLLVIPSTYQTYNELAEEFSNVLRKAAAWAFAIV